ncbi:twin-arginine translocase subunit TatC [Bermanella marisrubri]|uniref:Sec-independent protein translocase protein TatC n=1 Tax=Bermanella marisrubri TaxID=207949 RepID=Q1N200_9GAMM|nr:twin-arginine translocase subunit TatC [Bermanella marisrubri]EAT12364.1 transport protein TatC [Bermanella marisrubri]QIZ85447.1 twin-arginine translocase subunit TatC [Bermanella marisrubri]
MAKQSKEEKARMQQEQPLISHLIELRNRLLKSLLLVLIVFAGLYSFSNELYLIVSQPLKDLLPEQSSMIATGVASPFLVPFKLSLFAAVFLAIPFILHQAWAFISPGLYQNEKRFAIPLLLSSILLFYAGIAFAYFIVLPIVFGFFTAIGPEGVSFLPDINNILNFILKIFFAFGIAFEIPVATLLMIMAGITTVESLKEKRPYIFIGCFVVGMLVTPPDVISQTVLALPMYLLFEAGILFGNLVQKRKTDSAEDEQTSL